MWHVMCRYERIPAMTSHWEKADCHFNYIIVNNVLPQIHPYCRLNLYCKGRKYSVPTYERLSHSLPLKPFKEVFLPCDSAGHLTLQDKDILTVNGNSLPEQCVGRGGSDNYEISPTRFQPGLGLDETQRAASHKPIWTLWGPTERAPRLLDWFSRPLSLSVILLSCLKTYKKSKAGSDRTTSSPQLFQ